MGNILVIAEKNEVGIAIAKAICDSEAKRLPARGNGYTVAAASGHLLELVEPHDVDERLRYAGGDWDISDLPIIFKNWKLQVKRARDEKGRKKSEPDERAQAKVDMLQDLVAQADVVVNAGDPDDEGQRIVDELLEEFGYSGTVKRVYINDTIAKNIRREFERMRDNGECRKDGDVAYARAMADMVFGVNDTRLLAKRTGLGNVSLGRVQTPVLRMVVERDMAIENHEEKLYYEAQIGLSDQGGSFGQPPLMAKLALSKDVLEEHGDGKRVYERDVMEGFAWEVEEKAPVEFTVKRSRKEKQPPLPYNITQLEADMSDRYKYKPEDTLAATQALRKISAITYNRTPSSYLKEEHYEEAPSVLGVAMENIGCSWELDFSLKTAAFNDEKCTAHHGIIPQQQKVDVARLSEIEANVYQAIVERYALQFTPPAVYDVCEGEVAVACGKLRYSARRLCKAGWMNLAENADEDEEAQDTTKPMVDEGTYVCSVANANIIEKKTAPPKRYTQKTLLNDMASASKYVKDPELKKIMREKDAGEPDEHGGIGTSATRHAILATLEKRGFIERKGKNVISTPRGRAIYKILPEGLGTVDMTARWYLVQEEIRNGNESVNLLPQKVAEEFAARRDTAYVGIEIPDELRPSKTYVGKCPKCGNRVVLSVNSLQCETNKWSKTEEGWKLESGCGWSLSKRLKGKKLTDKQVVSLFEGKAVKVKNMISKAGKPFEAKVKIEDPLTGKYAFEFEDRKTTSGRRKTRR